MGKAGRPKIQDPKRTVPCRLRNSLIDKVKAKAEENERSLSYMIEKAVQEKYSE